MPADQVPEDLVADPRITLLGPQRNPRIGQVVADLGLGGRRFATITTGWRDREADDDLLAEQLGHHCVNLGLWQLMQQVWESDPQLAEADRRRRLVHTEMQELYLIGLEQAVEALRRIRQHTPREPQVVRMAVEDVLSIMREMDERHLERVGELNHDFYARWEPHHRDSVVAARFHVGRLVADTEGVIITGGHVGVLLGALHLFNLGPALAAPPDDAAPEEPGSTPFGQVPPTGSGPAPRLLRPIVAWGAGAMALTERVLLFYDDPVAAPGVSELLMNGLALTRGLVALPSPRDRLMMRDQDRMRMLCARTAPWTPLLLEERVQVTLTADGRLPAGARVLGEDGLPHELEADA